MTHHPDPDPRHVPEDDALWDPQAAAWVPRPSVLWALLVGVIAGAVLGFLVAVAVVSATSRPVSETPVPAQGRTGAPQSVDRGDRSETRGYAPADADGLASASTRPSGGAPFLPSAGSLARTSQSVAGLASWYRDPKKPADGLYGAVPGWHYGDQPYALRVTAGSRSVVVLIGDCLCGGIAGRVVDLSPEGFRRLAPLSAGVIRVSIERVTVPSHTPPPTDLEP